MKKIPLLCIIAFIMIFTYSCKKKKDIVAEPPIEYERDLSPEGVIFWDNQESVTLDAHNIVLPNGSRFDDFLKQISNVEKPVVQGTKATNQSFGPQHLKNQLITKLTSAALYFTNRNNFVYPAEGPGKPKQNGLAYSWGQRNYQIRSIPPGQGNVCRDEVYGLDCSGLFYNLFKRSGVEVSNGTADSQRKTSALQAAILKAYPTLTKIKIEDLGKISSSNMETGDIIYWIEDGVAKHIGLVLLDANGSKSIAQSNGSETDGCESNYSLKRGPRFSPLDKAILARANNGYGDNYSIVRVNTELSGKWTFSIRCAGAATTVFDLNLDFPVATTNTFTAKTTAKDYDGSTVTLNFTFTYNNIENELSCVYTTTDSDIPGFERKDSFIADLGKGDDTGFIAAINQYIRNGSGCSEEIRLVNNEVQPTKLSAQRTEQSTSGINSFIGIGYRPTKKL